MSSDLSPEQAATQGVPQSVPHIPDYEFSEHGVIGEGAFGKVWFGLYKDDQPRAVKVYKPDALRQEMWRAEYEKLKALDEPPGIVTLYDQGETEGGLPYVAMRLMADEVPDHSGWVGRTLQRRIDANDLDSEVRWKLVFEIADILAYLHRQGVVHCDVKPSNVLLTAGDEPRPVICDFGQSVEEGFSPEEISGTLLYASPEQLRRDDSKFESWDVYSFGVTAFQLITGRLPRLNKVREELRSMGGASLLETMVGLYSNADALKASLDRELIPLLFQEAIEAEREIDFPAEVEGSIRKAEMAVVLRCLALKGDPNTRYSSMTAVVEAFREVKHRRAGEVERRKKTIYATLMVFGLIAAGLAGWQWLRAETSRERAEHFGNRAAESATEQKRLAGEAQRQRDEAELQATIAEAEKEKALESERVALLARTTAEKLINNMLYDLKNRLEPLGRLDLLDRASEDIETYFDELPESQRNKGSERGRSAMLIYRGEVAMALGHYGRAERVLLEAKEVRVELLNQFPESLQRKRDLSVAAERLGDVRVLQGNLDGAEKDYRECLDLRDVGSDQLTVSGNDYRNDDRNEGIAGYRSVRDSAVAQLKLSDVLARKGRFPESQEAANAGLGQFRALADLNPGDFRAKRDLGGALLQCGDLSRHEGKPEDALKYYQEGASLLGEFVSRAPRSDTLIRQNYSACLTRLAEWYADQGESGRATEYFEEALPMVEELARLDPENLDWTRNLALLHSRRGELQLAMGQLESSEGYFRKSVDLFERLTEHEEPQPVWLDDAQLAWIGFGDLLSKQGGFAVAEEAYLESLALARRRMEMTGDSSPLLKANLIVSLFKSALSIRASGAEGRKAAALELLNEALVLLQETEGEAEDWEGVLRAEIKNWQK